MRARVFNESHVSHSAHECGRVEAGAGVGKVFAELDDSWDAAGLPGVWGSGTYRIREERDMRARVTLAHGKSSTLFYFAVGQNF